MLRCVHKWPTPTAHAAAKNTSTIVAMGRSACPVPIAGTMNPIQSPQLSANSALLLTIPNPALRTLNSALLRLVSALRCVFSKLDLNLIFFIEAQSISI